MIAILMKKHLVSDSNSNTVNLTSPNNLQGTTNNVGLTSSAVTLDCNLQLVLSKTIRGGRRMQLGLQTTVPPLGALGHDQ